MYDMTDWKSNEQKKKESLSFTITVKPQAEKFNTYVNGYGVHGHFTKKAKHKADRKAAKQQLKRGPFE